MGYQLIVSELFTVNEAAAELRVARKTVRRWIRNGQLEHVALPSGRLRVPVQALADMQVTPTTPARGQDKQAQRGRRL